MSFEKKLRQLEEITENLSDGSIPLDGAVKQYEKGVRLLKECYSILESTEKKITVLMKSLEGDELIERDFDEDEVRGVKPK